MWIKGYIHRSEDEAVLGNVHIVRDIARYAGVVAGYMDVGAGEVVLVKRHPAGTYLGMIVREGATA